MIKAKDHPLFAMMPSVTGKPKRSRSAHRSRSKQSATNSLTDAVITLIKLSGGTAWRNDSKGTWREDIQMLVPSKQPSGLPDVIGIMPGGKFIGVEVKTQKDKMSKAQIEWMNRIIEKGGKYIIARDIEQVKRELL